MTGNIGSNGAAIEAVVIINGEIATSDGINHVVVYPAKIGAIGLPFDNSCGFHI